MNDWCFTRITWRRCKKCGMIYPAIIPFCPYCNPELFVKLERKMGEERYGGRL